MQFTKLFPSNIPIRFLLILHIQFPDIPRTLPILAPRLALTLFLVLLPTGVQIPVQSLHSLVLMLPGLHHSGVLCSAQYFLVEPVCVYLA